MRPGPSARLRAVAELVPVGARVADVGTDHAQLLAWLRVQGRIAGGIGIDVVPGPLREAARTLRERGIEGIELRQGDGLAPLRPGEVDVVVLAGMGGARIVRLLEARAALVEGLRALVLQPNTDWVLVRRHVAAKRWALTDERMVEDRGKHYVVLGVRPQPQAVAPAWDEHALVLGPRLLIERPPAFVAWLRYELHRTERARARASRGAHATARVAALQAHANRVRAALAAAADERDPVR